MTDHCKLRDRGFLSPDCRCPVTPSKMGHEIEWNPQCPIHKDDVTGATYRPPNR